MLRIGVLLATTGLWAIPALADDVVISVGPGGQYQRIADAVARADADTDPGNYYVINVVPGTYRNDFPEVTRPMTIQVDPAFPGQQAILMATIPLPNQKGIILTSSSLHVNGLVFTGAQIDESLGGNGAGIRDQNPENTLASLAVENSVFHDNQAGILQGDDIAETVTIINSQFMNNGTFHPHAVYIDEAASLTVTGSLFCGQLVAHDIKSRASATTVVNSTIYDGQGDPAIGCRDGSSSFAIDVPNGGVTVISGNLIIQGPSSPNFKMVAYSEEGLIPGAANSLMVSGNTFINIGGQSAIGVYEPICVVPAQLMNNTFQNVATPVYPPECAVEQTVSPPPPPPPSPPPAPPPSPPPAPPPPSPPPPPIACTPVYDANFNLTCQ